MSIPLDFPVIYGVTYTLCFKKSRAAANTSRDIFHITGQYIYIWHEGTVRDWMGSRLLYCFNMCASKRHSITVGIVYKQGKYHGAQKNPRVQVD